MRAVPPMTLTVLTWRLLRASLSTETIPARKIIGSVGSRSSSMSQRRMKASQERTIDLLDRLPDGERAEYQGDVRGRDEGATEEAQHGGEYLLLAEECGDDDQDQANDECEHVGQEHRSSNPDGGGGSHAAGAGADLGDDLHHAQGRVADGDAGEGGVGFVGAEIGERDPRVR